MIQIRKTGVSVRKICHRTMRHVIGWVFAGYLIASCPCSVLAAEANLYRDPAWNLEMVTVVQSGKCKIMAMGIYSWRDWMPIVANPGPDGGSPLYIKIDLVMDNSTGEMNKFSFSAVIVDDKGQSYPATFRVLPNFLVIPDAIAKSYKSYDNEDKKSIMAQYSVLWNGTLNAGETRNVSLYADRGPYLPVGSKIHVRMEWTDNKGNSVMLKTPEKSIKRTD
jgi:hypothetical protein